MQDFLNNDSQNKEDEFFLKSGLYVVSTPIGNIQDITLRAVETIKKCDLVICEDTRITARLLNFIGVKKTLMTYNDHSDQLIRNKILGHIKCQNKAVCLVSDAGTPLISDPGYKLIDFLLNNKVKVTSIPGPCSPIAALSISGIESDKFVFAGFIPHIKSQQDTLLDEFKDINCSLIFFESASRVLSSLKSILKVLGDRKVAVAREITKLYEEVKRGKLSELVEYYSSNKIKGEVIIMVSKATKQEKKDNIDFDLVDRDLKSAIQKMSSKDSIAIVSENYGINKKILYKRLLNLKE